MTFIEQLARDMKEAMKTGDAFRLSVIRMLSTALQNKVIEKRGRGDQGELTDEEAIAVLRTEAKKRSYAASEFEKGGRPELAEKETREIAVVEAYLPAEAPDEEIENAVRDAVSRISAGPKDFGRVMGEAMRTLKGRVSGDRVSTVVRRVLGA